MVLPRMDDDLGNESILFTRQHNLGRDERVAKPPLEFLQSGFDETPQGGSDLDLSAGQQ